MLRLADAKLTVAEAAFVTKMAARDIDREIDARVVRSSGPKGTRALSGDALVYLKAVGPLRGQLTPALRKRISKAIAGALAKGEAVAKIDALQVPVKDIQREILHDYAELEKLKRIMVESREEVLGGEPVLKGTRVPVRIVAELIEKGVSEAEIEEELELTSEQIRAAVIYYQIAPKRGRPHIERINVKILHVPAD